MSGTGFKLGPVTLRIAGDHPVARLVKDEISAPPTTDAPDLDVRISPARGRRTARFDSLVTGSRFLLKHKVALSEGNLFCELGAKAGSPLYQVTMSSHPTSEQPTSVEIVTGWDSKFTEVLSRPFSRALTRDYSRLPDLIAKNIVYEILDPLLLCKLLSQEATLAHAGAVATRQKDGVAFLGAGGAGKSTLVLKLVRERNWFFIGDDYSILDPIQGVVRYPKRLQVYAYNVSNDPDIQKPLLSGRSRTDRAVWHIRRGLLGIRQARRRVRDTELFSESSVIDSAPLKLAAFLSPAPAGLFSASPADPSETARRSASVLISEMWGFMQLLNAFASLDPSLPSVADLHDRVADVTGKVLPQDACYELRLPGGLVGDEVAEWLEGVLSK